MSVCGSGFVCVEGVMLCVFVCVWVGVCGSGFVCVWRV